MLDYSKHLSFFYGDAVKLKDSISYQLERYEALVNKSINVVNRIKHYKDLLKT